MNVVANVPKILPSVDNEYKFPVVCPIVWSDFALNFIANGVNSSLVEFIPLESQTHSTGAIPYILDIFDKFENLK